MARILFLMMFPFMCFSQITPSEDIPVNNLLKEKENLDTKRKASYNLDEIKVRWKKAALENCPGVPCVVTPPAPSFTCGTSTITDVDNNIYNTVLIGTQCWTTTNLKVTKYNDGITSIPDETANAGWGTLGYGARTEYVGVAGVVTGYVSTYGYLYNWYAAAGIITSGGAAIKNICPVGWRVPSNSDWNKLAIFINTGADTTSVPAIHGSAISLKKNDALWLTTNGTDNYGFSALPGGLRKDNPNFNFTIRNIAYFWSTTELPLNPGLSFSRDTENDDFRKQGFQNFWGMSVRCLRD
ncbi:MAG: hypothetical protein LW711_14175 [Saprospiraceae bacterium]|jgi:uncharacterized protein (TIGR02145 family)|nr:hypothetical protein [Saprospiraceae bacterium]